VIFIKAIGTSPPHLFFSLFTIYLPTYLSRLVSSPPSQSLLIV
jgi:hypothetical protein